LINSPETIAAKKPLGLDLEFFLAASIRIKKKARKAKIQLNHPLKPNKYKRFCRLD